MQDVEATIHRLRLDREALREQIAAERERIARDRARSAEALEMNVIAQWESGRSVKQIATSLGRSAATVNKIITEWRRREGVTVRRGPPMRERSMLR